MADALSLTKALSTLLSRSSRDEVFTMLQSVFTTKEIEYLEKRLRIAHLLRKEYSYTEIQKELKVSAATVASVSEQMKDELFLKLVLRMEKELARFQFLKRS